MGTHFFERQDLESMLSCRASQDCPKPLLDGQGSWGSAMGGTCLGPCHLCPLPFYCPKKLCLAVSLWERPLAPGFCVTSEFKSETLNRCGLGEIISSLLCLQVKVSVDSNSVTEMPPGIWKTIFFTSLNFHLCLYHLVTFPSLLFASVIKFQGLQPLQGLPLVGRT